MRKIPVFQQTQREIVLINVKINLPVHGKKFFARVFLNISVLVVGAFLNAGRCSKVAGNS